MTPAGPDAAPPPADPAGLGTDESATEVRGTATGATDGTGPTDTGTAAAPVRPLRDALALLIGAPRWAVGLAAASLAVGLTLEGLLAAGLGPVRPAGGPADAAALAFNVVALLNGVNGRGIVQWFARWLAAVLLTAWLCGRVADRLAATSGAGEARRPPLSSRVPVLLGSLVVVTGLVLLPAAALLAAGSPWWLALLAVAWPALRLSLVTPAAVLGPTTIAGAVLATWHRTRRRELYTALVLGTVLTPGLAAAGVVLAVAIHGPGRFTAVWWLAVAGAWLWWPFAATAVVLLWRRLRARAGDAVAPVGGGDPDVEPAAAGRR